MSSPSPVTRPMRHLQAVPLHAPTKASDFPDWEPLFVDFDTTEAPIWSGQPELTKRRSLVPFAAGLMVAAIVVLTEPAGEWLLALAGGR